MHLVHYTTNMATYASRFESVPVFLGIRGPRLGFGSALPNILKSIFEKSAAKITIKMSRLVLFDCEASYRSITNVDISQKSTILYAPVDTKKFVPKPKDGNDLVVLFVGSLTPTKGLTYLIQAIPIVLQRFPNVKFWIAGEGILRPKLEALVKALRIERNVVFLGYRNDIPELLGKSDVFVLPSVSEGVSLALLQAGASGKACVATNVGGNVEVISEGVDGFLVPPFSASALGHQITRLCEDEELRRRFGRAIRLKVEETFDVRPVITKLEDLARRVVSEK